jgi:hypothetical protein
MTAQYVYGVTFAATAIPEDLAGIDGVAVTLVTHGRCGAVVSDLNDARPLGTRDDLLAHENVLASLAQGDTPVLPFRFGAAMSGPGEVAGELLSGNEESLLAELEQLAGRVELVVKGRYDNGSAYREVLAEEPEILEIRERIQGLPEDTTYNERVHLGELVAHAMAAKQAADGERLVAALSPYAERLATRPPAREDEAANVAFLVERDRRAEFERAVEALGEQWAGRVRLRLLGPLPPYDFVGSGSGQEAA